MEYIYVICVYYHVNFHIPQNNYHCSWHFAYSLDCFSVLSLVYISDTKYHENGYQSSEPMQKSGLGVIIIAA